MSVSGDSSDISSNSCSGNKENNSTKVPDFLLDRLWDSYTTTDDRRRRAFYFMYTGIAILFIYWFSIEENYRLPFLGVEVDRSATLAITPSIILILVVRYLYLSAHSMISFMSYFKHLQRFYESELSLISSSFVELHSMLKGRDATENVNLFMFPMRPAEKWQKTIPSRLLLTITVLSNVGILFTVIIPILSYFISVYWILVSRDVYDVLVWLSMLIFYSLMGVLLLLAPIYFYYRTREARSLFLEYN